MEVFNLVNSTVLFLSIILICVNSTDILSKNKPLQIIDGSEVIPHSLPYMVAIRTNIDGRSVLCGGSLLTHTLVLTAATCLHGASEAVVILGAHNLDEKENTQVIRSAGFTIHEKYTNESKTHDIALIKLPSAVEVNDNVQLIELPSYSDISKTYDEEEGLVAGWGKTSDTANRTSSVLRAANLTIIPVLVCEITQAFQINFDQMCTSGVSIKNICLGDAGSPLVVKGIQVGIASYGTDFGCAVGFPGVYTRVTSYLDWLGLSLG